MLGETTGRKLDPVTVARQMKHTKRFCLPRRFKVSFQGGQNAKAQKASQYPTKTMKQLKMKKRWQPYEMRYWSIYSPSTRSCTMVTIFVTSSLHRS